MDFPKKQAQRLMPLYLLEYSEKLFNNHPNPEDPWGGGNYTAGQGITITNNEISVDTNVIATKSDLPTKTSELTNDSDFISSSLTNRKVYSISDPAPHGGSWKRVTYDTNGILIETSDSTHTLGLPINKEGEIAVTSDIPDFTNYYYINNEIQNGEYITKINGSGLEYSKQWSSNSISITADYNEMGFDHKPAVVIKTDMNKRVVVSDSIAVYNEHNSVTGMDGDKVVVSSGDNKYTRLENGKLTYEGDGQVREFNLPTTKGQGTYTLATIDDYPIYDPQDQLFISLTGEENTFYKNVDLSTAPGRMFYVNLSALNPVFKDGLTSTYNDITNQLEVSLNAVIPTKTSDLFNDSGYVTETWVQNQGYATSSSLATVATTGSYNDLTDKPAIPSTATSTSTSTVTPTTGTFVTGTSTNTADVVNSVTYTPSSETLTFTYADNTTASFTFLTSSTTVTSGTTSVVTSVTDSTSNAMTGATVSTSTTTTLS